jgi:DNA primase small subunit
LAASNVSTTLDTKALLEAKQDIVLEYTYPRLDAEVSKKLNHLLKSPFCVHPKTGRVCVPIDTRNVEAFDPFSVPTVVELLGDLDKWHAEHEGEANTQNGTNTQNSEAKIPDWEKTKLKPYVDYFRGFVAGLLRDEKAGKRNREEGEPMEF